MFFVEQFVNGTIRLAEILERRTAPLTDEEEKILRAGRFLRAITVDKKLKVCESQRSS